MSIMNPRRVLGLIFILVFCIPWWVGAYDLTTRALG